MITSPEIRTKEAASKSAADLASAGRSAKDAAEHAAHDVGDAAKHAAHDLGDASTKAAHEVSVAAKKAVETAKGEGPKGSYPAPNMGGSKR